MTPPPIASPHVYEEKSAPKPPFLGLKIFIALDVVALFLAPINSLYVPHKSWAVVIVLYALYIPLWLLLLWHLWRGSGIARAILWWTNAVTVVPALLGDSKLNALPVELHYLTYLKHAFIIGGLVWLQLPGVKAHFRREQTV